MEENNQGEKEIESGNHYYRMLFQNMLEGFAHCQMIFDDAGKPVDFTYLEVNPMFETLTKLKDVIGKRVSEVIPGIQESDPGLFEIYGRVAMTGKPERLEIYLEAFKIWFLISVYSAEKGFFTAIFDNITEHKQSEEKLRTSMNELKKLMDAIPEVVYVLDTERNVIKWNHKAETATGYSAEELKHKFALELMPENERPVVIDAINDAYDKGYVEATVHLLRKDGTLVPYRWSGAPLRNEKGDDIGIIGIGWDLTEQIESEKKIHLYQMQQRVILDAIPEVVWMKDVEGVYITVNEAYLIRVGKRRDEIIGKTDLDIWPKEFADKYQADDKEVIDSCLPKRIEETVPDFKGNIIWVETVKTPIYSDTGKLLGVAGVARDITAEKRLTELQQQKTA